MEQAYVLEARDISKSFGEAQVLKNVDFSLRAGEIHALMGENGAGKSTLIKIISGDYSKDSGTIFIEGEAAKVEDPHTAIQMGIRVIHQEINTVRPMTVAENIYLGNFPRKKNGLIDWGKLYRDASAVLEEMGEEIQVTRKLSDLSIAEQQIVEIAKALSVRPKVLIMDEPTAALNDQETDKLFELLQRLASSGVAIIYITHRFSEVYKIANRVTVMRDGEKVGTLDVTELTDEKLVKMMVGKDVAGSFQRKQLDIGEEIFTVKHLSAAGSIQDINLHVCRGEIVVIFGLFGAGQRELCRAVFGDIPLTAGEIDIKGKKVVINSVSDACNQGIGYVSDDRKAEALIPLLSVKKNITLTALWSKLRTKLGFIMRDEETRLAQANFNMLNVKCNSIDQQIGSLSGGNQQKSIICRWLANDAEVLLLNMPTRGVDVHARMEIYNTLEGLAARGVAVLVVSLEMPEVLSIADRIYVMRENRVVAEVPRAEASQELLLRYALGVH